MRTHTQRFLLTTTILLSAHAACAAPYGAMEPIPGTGGSMSFAISGNGGTVLAQDTGSYFLYTTTSTFIPPTGDAVGFFGMARDATNVVGFVSNGSYSSSVIYNVNTGYYFIPDVGPYDSYAVAISDDGKVVAGYSDEFMSGTETHAYVVNFNNSPNKVDLGTSGVTSSAVGISGDGSIVVGSTDNGLGYERGAKWTFPSGTPTLTMLDPLNNSVDDASSARAISRDGSTIVGESHGGGIYHAVKWDSAGTITEIGDLGGFESIANTVNADGSIIYGLSQNSSFEYRTFRWTQSAGIQDFETLLTAAGVDLTGIHFSGAPGGTSDSGEYVAVNDNDNGQSYVVYYSENGASGFGGFGNTGPIGGVTTISSVRESIRTLANQQVNQMAEFHATTNTLLGATRPATSDSYIFAGGMVGSGAGMFGGQVARDANSLRGGIAFGHQNYDAVDTGNDITVALAARHNFERLGKITPYIEFGGSATPDQQLTFTRHYANGAGTATGSGTTDAYSWTGYGQLGVIMDTGNGFQLTGYGELGQQAMHYDAYSEMGGTANPFPASAANGLLRYTATRFGGSASHTLTEGDYPLSASVSGAIVHAFNMDSNLRATVAGIGSTQASATTATWGEFGLQLNLQLAPQWSGNIGLVGTTGDSEMGTKLHGIAGVSYQF